VPQSEREMYFSVDVETDGPIPGRYSMLSFAAVAVATYDGRLFNRLPPDVERGYWELKPISESFEEEALAVAGLDRSQLLVDGQRPDDAMREAAAWVTRTAADFRPVLVAYPVAFDWMFLHWYFTEFHGSSPFGHAACIDIRSLYVGATGSTYQGSSKRRMPLELRSMAPHTHNAHDDAVEQGELFCNVFERALRVTAGAGDS
jgi:hypothetical protein